MSYYGGGGGWVPPGFYTPNQGMGPPPIQQPPPTAYYPQDATGYAQQGRGPYDYVQPGYGSVPSHPQPQGHPVPVSHPSQPPPDMTTLQTSLYSSVPPPQQQALTRGASNSPLVPERGRTSLDRSRDSHSPPRRRSPTPEDRYDRRPASNRRRDLSPEEIRYRRRRSPSGSPDRPYSREPRPRGRSPEMYEEDFKRGRKDESELSKQIPQKSKADPSGVDLDALLKDERLRNVLFAGISKATAKLEQSLKQDEPKDNMAFHGGSLNQGKSQLFPSASTSGSSQEKPRSILKRKADPVESSDASAAFSNLTTLEKTLQMLRGKTDPGESSSGSSREKPKTKAESKLHGALGQLVSYDDDNDEEAYLYSNKEPLPVEKKKTSAHPFWSVNAVAASREEETRDPDTFEMKDKMFEKWRQSIQKSPERQMAQSRDSSRDRLYEKETRAEASRLPPGKKEENQEELDSTVQNILQSIGFDFDLSQRMQQLARKKKIQEEEKTTGISNMSASFLGKGSILTEELKASLLQSGNDLSKIDSLLQEARASVHLERSGKRRERSPRERSPSPFTRRDKSPEVDRAVMLKDRLKAKMSLSDWADQDGELRRLSKSHGGREYEVSSSRDGRFLGDRRIRSAFHVSENLDDAKDEYFYPEKDSGEIPPGVPLLKSYNSRQKNEDLSSGLLKSLRVENFRVMSRPVYDDENEEFTETRRIILPAKMERKVVSRSPSARESRSPSLRGGQKRSGSPMTMSALKERKVVSSRSSSLVEAQQKSPVYEVFRERFSPVSRDSGPESPERSPGYRGTARRRESVSPPVRRRLSEGRRSPSPKGSRLKYQRGRSRSPERRRSKSPRRYRSRSPIRRRSRSRSPRRRRSRSHSRTRYRRSPPRHTSPLRARRKPVLRRSHEKKDSLKTDAKTSVDKRSTGAGKKDTNAKAQTGGKPKAVTQVDLSKMTDNERKSHLQKMLIGKGATPVEPETPPKKESDNVNKIVESFEKLASSFTLNSKAELSTKLSQLSGDDRSKVLDNVKSRFSKIMLLKVEVVKLKKQQNEIMRKIQRRGIGPQNPLLSTNERKQGRIEKEIERLSAPELHVDIGEFSLEEEDESCEMKSSQVAQPSTPQVKTGTKKTAPGNLITVPLTKSVEQKPQLNKAAGSVSKTDTIGKKKSATPVTKDEKKKAAQTPSASGKNSWTSVKVDVEEELPIIANENTSKTSAKTENTSDSAVKTAPPRKKIYYEYIDGRNHYCPHCSITCQTIGQFFDHSHGKKHIRAITNVPKPWDEPKFAKGKNQKVGQAQTRRIKGIEMIMPVTGFYCSLCKVYCGDFRATESHLKSDSHYDKYLDYITYNTKYEKNLLLEKTKSQPASTEKKKLPSQEVKEEKGREKKAHLRVKTEKEIEKEDEDSGAYDQIGAVDMELDEDDRDDDMDVLSKVPKMVPKSLPFVPPPPPEPAMTDIMKTSKEDEVQPLDSFLTIKQEASGQQSSVHGERIPVVCSKTSVDLSNIPVPAAVPKPKPVHTVKSLQEVEAEEKRALDEEKRMMGIDVDTEEEKPLAAIKRPPILQDLSMATNEASDLSNIPVPAAVPKPQPMYTVKSLQQVTAEEKRAMDEEKRMMGIDVDAEEEKPLAAIKRPPALKDLSMTSESSEESTASKSGPKKTSVDNLFAKLNKSATQKRKPKVVSVVGGEKTEMELRIQQEIEEKLSKEKEKLLLNLQKAEERERRREERKLQKKKIYSSSESSSEESEEDHEEENSVKEGVMHIPLPDAAPQNLPTEQTPAVEAEANSTVDGASSSLAVDTPANDSSKNEAQIMLEDLPKSDEVSEIPMEVEEDKAHVVSVERVRKGRAAVKKKNPPGPVLATESDLFGVFSSSRETISQEARKKLNKKGGPKKRGKGPKASQETEGKEIIMEDYVVLSEVTEEDEFGLKEDVETNDEAEMVANPASDEIRIQMEKGRASPDVAEVGEDADVTMDTLNQELNIETTGDEDRSKSLSDKQKEGEMVEESSAQVYNNGQSDIHVDEALQEEHQLLSASTLNQDDLPPELERDDDEMISDGNAELNEPALTQDIECVDKAQQEELQMLSSAIVDQDIFPEAGRDDKEMIPDEHVEFTVSASSQQEELHMLSASTVNKKPPPELEIGDNEQMKDENVEYSVPALSQDERFIDEVQQEELQMLTTPTLHQDVLPSELERDDNEKILDEQVELTEPVLSQEQVELTEPVLSQEQVELTEPALSQEMPSISGQPVELSAPTFMQEVSPASEKDTENTGEEEPPVVTVPSIGRGGGRGRGRKSGGRGRGRGKRSAKKAKADDSTLTDESPNKADEKPVELQPPSAADTLAMSLNEEPENINVPSPSKRGRKGRAPTSSRRVTRSRVHQDQDVEDSLDSIVSEPAKAVVEEDVSVMTSSTTTTCETDSLPDGGQFVDEEIPSELATDSLEATSQSVDEQIPSEVGIESLETMCNPNLSTEDVQVIPSLPEEPSLSTDVTPVLDSKDGSDSDATITEDQETVEFQSIFDDGQNLNAPTPSPEASAMCGMESVEPLEESGDASCLDLQGDQNQQMPVADDSCLWDETYQDGGSDIEDASGITAMQQDVSSLTTHTHASQPRDPPMSGIVSEVEALDSIMDVDGDGTDTARPEANIPESERLPTSGLGLDLEDVTDSISFPLDDDNAKTDPNEAL